MTSTTHPINVENVVATTDLGRAVTLADLAEDLDAKFDPGRFPGLIYRLQDPELTALIFRSGSIVTTGATSVDDARTGTRVVLDTLAELGVDGTDSPDVTVENIVSCSDLGCDLQLTELAVALGLERTEYEPEQFPGLIYRLENPSVVALLFASGRIVLTGCTRIEEASTAIDRLDTRLTNLGVVPRQLEAGSA